MRCKLHHSCVLLLLLALSASTGPLRAVTPEERAALIAFYHSTQGDGWHNRAGWLGPAGTECSWAGVSCTADGSVDALRLYFENLAGALPPELGQLTHLTVLSLSYDGLTGSIPAELGKLANLRLLDLSSNRLTGSLPPELGRLSWLQSINLGKNLIGGGIPPELGNLPALQFLDLSGNQLTGPIPAALTGVPGLVSLRLDENRLTGEIPPNLAEREALNFLDLEGNHLTGELPSGWRTTRLYEFDLAGNELTGEIPPELGNQPALYWLRLAGNHLTGEIPPGLANDHSLLLLDLEGNPLTPGPVPEWITSLPQLMELDLRGTNRTGPIPDQLDRLTSLLGLELGDNPFDPGPIPPLPLSLNGLGLQGTHRTGTLPEGLASLRRLQYLDLGRNHLTGEILSSIGQLSQLVQIRLESNQFSGAIPGAILASPALRDGDGVDIRWNALSLGDPTLITRMSAKQVDGKDWKKTETVPPANLKAVALGPGTVRLSWTPIAFRDGAGSYRIYHASSAAGPFTLVATTADKRASQIDVTGLAPASPHCFRVQTTSLPHPDNANAVVSAMSEMAVAATPAQ